MKPSAAKLPTVSVIIPVYNRPLVIRRAIDSVLRQTYTNFEIIVVDDGSTDDVSNAVASIDDSRLTIIRHHRNRGGSAARNTGIQASSGSLIAFLDSDDEWLPTKLERQVEIFAHSSERLGLVYTGTERIFADGSVQVHIPRRYDDLAVALLTANVVGETSVGMVRRRALEVIGGFDENLPASQDMDLWLRLSERFLADFVPEPLVRVAKGDDRGRISANVAGFTRARALFCRKHREKLLRQGLLHTYLRESGWTYQRLARDARRARRCYSASLAVRPTALVTYVLLLAACLPMSWLDRIAHYKHQIDSLLRLGAKSHVLPRSFR